MQHIKRKKRRIKMDIKNIKTVLSKGNNKDILDFYNINKEIEKIPFVTSKIAQDIRNGEISHKEIILQYFNGKIILSNEEFDVELISTSDRKKEEIMKMNEPIFLSGILKYSPIKKIFSLNSFEKINLFYDIEDWISIFESTSFDRTFVELLAGLNMSSSNLLLREKNMFLLRLVPLVQKNYLLIDFSKRATRKTRTYGDLGYHIPAAYNFTRAKIIYDQSQKQKGLIFSAKGNVLILDEFQNNSDDGITVAIQQWKNDGAIYDDKGNRMPLEASVIILGNPKKNINYPYIFTHWQNIFDGTTIYKEKVSTGDAFLSRVDCLVPSWCSRNINNEMLLKNDVERIPPYILRSVFLQLREIDISNKVETIISQFNLKVNTLDSRSQRSIENTFEGLIKLLLPCLIKKSNYEDYKEELLYLYNLALEGKAIVNNMINKIKPENILTKFHLSTKAYLSKEKNVYILPHRKIYFNDKIIIKEALDSIGILQNKEEMRILQNVGIDFKGNYIKFNHSYNISNLQNLNIMEYKYKELIIGGAAAIIIIIFIPLIKNKKMKLNFKEISSLLLGIYNFMPKKAYSYLKKMMFSTIHSDDEKNIVSKWNKNINFNHLIGEYEEISYPKSKTKLMEYLNFYMICEK